MGSGDRVGRQTRDFAELEEPRTMLAQPVKGFRPSAPRPHLLEARDGPQGPLKLVLDRERYVLGRGSQATLPLESEEVSRQHAQLTRVDGEYTIEDLGSRNGILLNGVRVHAALLRDGDRVQLGDVVLTYREGS